MRQVLARPLHQAKRQVADDLRSDPYLVYILALAGILAAFWIWHRLPNFATRDERWRVVDPVEALAQLAEEVSYESLRDGVTYWRSYGATFYSSALVLIPVLVVVVVLGQLEGFLRMGRHQGVSFWTHWLRPDGWIWSASVLAVRLLSVAGAVGSVYLVYRIATTMRDRATGRLAALLMTFTWGLLVLAHEAGEDVPSLFFFLLAFYLVLRYLETGSRSTFYWACFAGGLGTAVKLNVGVSAVLIGVAFLARAGREPGDWRENVVRPRTLLTGMGIGLVLILVGYPSVIVGDPAQLGGRLSRLFTEKRSPHGWIVRPSWWWILRGYFHGLGLPLVAAAALAIPASLPSLRERSTEADGLRLALLGVALFVLIYSSWAYVRTHHLLPTFPLVVIVVAAMGMRLRSRRPRVARPLLALLLVTSGAYAVGGDLAYASQPRDQATAYIAERAGPNTTVETYVGDPQEAAVPHDVTVYRPTDRTMTVDGELRTPWRGRWTRAVAERCPDYVVLGYHKSLMYLAPPSWGERAASFTDRDLQRYVRDLLAEDTYAYEVAARYGREPRYLRDEGRRSTWHELFFVGVHPRTIQYGDPQDMGVDQYTIVLERSGECDPEANSPFRTLGDG